MDVEKFLKKVNYPGVVLYDELEDAPKKTTMLDLILKSGDHRNVMLKILAEGYLDKEMSTEKFENMMEGMITNDNIIFL